MEPDKPDAWRAVREFLREHGWSIVLVVIAVGALVAWLAVLFYQVECPMDTVPRKGTPSFCIRHTK